MQQIKSAFFSNKGSNWHRNLEEQTEFESVWERDAVVAWLTKTGSMTQHLNAVSKENIKVLLLEQGWRLPYERESAMLGIPSTELVFVRKVILLDGCEKYMYACSVFPASTLEGQTDTVLKLDDTPLGKLLFKDPTLERTPFLYTKFEKNHHDYQLAVEHLSEMELPSYLWARQSIFCWLNRPILLTEIFLPALLQKKLKDLNFSKKVL